MSCPASPPGPLQGCPRRRPGSIGWLLAALVATGCLPSAGEEVDSGPTPSGSCYYRELPRPEGDPAVVGTTAYASHNEGSPCSSSRGPDLRFLWRPDTTDSYRISTEGSSFDTVLYVYEGCNGPVMGCNDDSVDRTSTVVVSAEAGQTYVIVVDGYDRPDAGNFELSVTR